VTSKTSLVVGSKPMCRGMRAIGYVLLFMVLYGATVALVHGHGPHSPNQSGVAAVSDAGGSPSSNTSHSRYTECQICQLHQHLFNGLVQAPLFARMPLTEIAFVSNLIIFHHSNSITPSSVRGPPLG